MTAIANAGVSSRNEHPYPRAFEKLARIYELSDPSLGQRAGTLWLMTQLPVPDRVLPFLRQVAVSQDRVAYRAVQLLAREMGPAGLGIARELYENALVTEPEAAKILNQIAEYHGWGGRADLDVEGWIPPPGPPTPR